MIFFSYHESEFSSFPEESTLDFSLDSNIKPGDVVLPDFTPSFTHLEIYDKLWRGNRVPGHNAQI